VLQCGEAGSEDFATAGPDGEPFAWDGCVLTLSDAGPSLEVESVLAETAMQVVRARQQEQSELMTAWRAHLQSVRPAEAARAEVRRQVQERIDRQVAEMGAQL
jgi:hypothetical protein